jgi:hypothetical protein
MIGPQRDDFAEIRRERSMKQHLLSALAAVMLLLSNEAVSVFLPKRWGFLYWRMVGGVL